jgi:hypothetical protein
MVNGKEFQDRHIDRDDPILVKIVQEMGNDVHGFFANLKIVEIPAEIDWQVDQHDGLEWISEKHRTWN